MIYDEAFDHLAPGTKIKFKDRWPASDFDWWNSNGGMDLYLGKTVTFLEWVDQDKDRFLIEEDEGECGWQKGGHWIWYLNIIECIEDEVEVTEFNVASEDDLFSFVCTTDTG